ncbi:MAG: amino acid adenylation domain-containing protein, partial [Pseudomonadales bacterium]
RTMVETERLIGVFINTLVLRTKFEDGSTLREVLSQVRQVTLGAYEHQDLPFEKLVEELRPARHMSHSPLFQVMVVLQNQPDAPANFHDLKVRREFAEVGSSMFDVSLYVQPARNGLELTFEYSTDLFDGSTIARWAGHFERLLEGIVADPDARVSELPLLSDEERNRLLVEWNKTEAAYAREATLHGLFEAQAARTPEAVALEFDGDQLSYGELNRRANRLANHLRDLGVAPEVLVAVCIERSAEMVVALLAVLKAGGAYVPLDPSYPRNRLEYMLSDSGAGVLLTQRRLAGRLSGHGANEVYVDTFDWSDPAHSEDNPVSVVKAEYLAYVMYTSGSTGDPKGVLGVHRATINRLSWMWETFPFTDGDLCCHKTSLNFVDSVAELFGPLLRGVCVVVVGQEDIRDPRALVSCLAAHGVTRVLVVPSLLRVILDAHAELSRILPKLRYWVTSGETLTKDLAERFKAAYPAAVLLNFYGSSEVAADSTGYDTSSGTSFSNVPIGRPIANTKLYVLDEFMEPVPIGVSGELYIGGESLARGYLKRPELTAERFVENPFESGQRIYRTGDLVHYRPDGNLEIEGRIDHQVKIRGIRIELGEIEAAMRRHYEIRNCTVVVRPRQARRESIVALERSARDSGGTGEQLLAAYFIATEAVPAPELRAHLEKHLPVHMVPQRFVQLEELPLNANRKLDVNALPDLDEVTRPEVKGAYLAPSTEFEKQITEVWQSVLGIEKIGINDGFLELGGDSLLAMQVLNRMRKTINLKMSFRELFEAQTVANLAAFGKERQDAAATNSGEAVGTAAAPPAASAVEDPERHYPLSNAQVGLWFLWQLDPDNPYYTDQGNIRIKGAFDLATLNKAWQALLDRHELTRVRFARQDNHPSQRFVPTPEVSFKIEDLTHLPEDRRYAAVEVAMRERAKRAFNLETDSLLEYHLYKLGEDEHVIAISFHEIILDLWGLTALIRDLGALYKHFADGNKAAPPPLPFRYCDFLQWERVTVTREKMAVQSDYWCEQLSGELPVLSLPTDRPYPTQPSYRGDSRSVFLDADLS